MDYINGGCHIDLIVAIDFTASNGDPNTSKSLHSVASTQLNDYEQVISTIGNTLAGYDSDKSIPIYGFGAEVLPNQSVNNCFTLDGSGVQGIPEILDIYRKTLQKIRLSGPSKLSEVIKVAIDLAGNTEVTQQEQKYFILLIITDGEASDMDETIKHIIRAADVPISIVIVGVGENSFEDMRILDADDAITRKKNGMKRDIVQFVPFRQFKGHDELLAKESLAEIPGQFLEFMQIQKIKPNTSSSKALPNLYQVDSTNQQTPLQQVSIQPEPSPRSGSVSKQVSSEQQQESEIPTFTVTIRR